MTAIDSDKHIPAVLRRRAPVGRALPLMFDSPHSGVLYPKDFRHDCPRDKIRWAEDSFIDEIYGAAPAHGAWLLAAEFPRTYIDPNRGVEDMDPALVDGAWPHTVRDNPKAGEGIGLIWQNGGGGVEIYERKLTLAEVEGRIARYWKPYHDELGAIADGIAARWGRRWHVNCHSFYSTTFGTELRKANIPEEDVILGNRDGETCDAAFVDVVATAFRDDGLSVAVNKRFKGAEIIAKLGDPANRCHSLQIELGKGLYMDERRMVKSGDFPALRKTVNRVVGRIAEYVRNQM